MALPRQSDVEIPLLNVLIELGGDAAPVQVYGKVAAHFPQLTDEDLRARMESGAIKWWNHVQWARQKLVERGEIDGSIRGRWRITEAGRRRAATGGAIRVAAVRRPTIAQSSSTEPSESLPPNMLIDNAYKQIRESLIDELLQLVSSCSPEFFEQLVIDLLVKMGYGGTRKDAGERLGRSGDGGVDGIIKEDRLGLGVIYVQAKKWDRTATVGRPDIQRFAGALHGRQAQKGVFLTTAKFSSDAREYADNIPMRIVLVDGSELAGLMIDFEIGVTPVTTYQLKRLDSDYFIDA